MGSVVDKLNYLKETKTAIRNALVEKGVEVADSDTFRSYAQKVTDIPAGGGDIDALIDGSITEIISEATYISSYKFNYCSKLTKAIFPNATGINFNAFAECTNLTEVSFPKVISIQYMAFYNCNSLVSVSFPILTKIIGSSRSGSFQNCKSLEVVSFPKIENIGFYSFYNCTNLKTIYIGIDSDKVCSLGSNCFDNCNSLTDIYVPEALVDSYKNATNWSNYAEIIKAYTGEVS